MITVSIITHNHGSMVYKLIENLENFPFVRQIILTLNISEAIKFQPTELLKIIHNPSPMGFGENHNNAFKICNQPYFCILNPDIEFVDDPFSVLMNFFQNKNSFLLAPIIVNSSGHFEDSARKFPTALAIIKKIFFSYDGRWPLDLNQTLNYPDWVAGMFMLFPAYLYNQIGGFDQNYFLYYEDVDICRRIRNEGYQIALCTQVKVIHNAQRSSRKNIKFLYWHVKSLCRYLFLKSK